ncbi:MAG: ABC transporter substrate-binding protein [Solirubrobacterales bacterium]
MNTASRNKTLKLLMLAVTAMVASLALAACGGDSVGGKTDSAAETAKAGEVTGDLTMSNWVGYMDEGDDNTIAEFEKETGVNMTYNEDVNDNDEFFGKMQPLLDKGESGGRDIMVVTDWMAKKMYDLGYLQDINHDDLPTVFANINPQIESPAFDPERKFSVPWQSGMTGLLVNKAQAPDIKSVNDLFDPQYKGKITILKELRDSVPLILKADGIDPEEATTQEWLDAIKKIDDAVKSGQFRRLTGNDYVADLQNENVVASIGWSGDTSLIPNKDVEWRMPTEGCIIWSDNMVIPKGAPNTPAALGWMDFVYQPEVQADLAAYIQYVSPVEGVKDILAKEDPELANSELIFPTAEFQKNCSTQPNPPGDAAEQEEVNEAFQSVVTGG